MSGGHTPGPWNYDKVETSCGHCFCIGSQEQLDQERSARTVPSYACLYVDYDNHAGQAEANARLIAVAPEMKDTVSGVLRDIGDVLRAWDQPASKEQLEAAERDLRAVLAKATGGAA